MPTSRPATSTTGPPEAPRGSGCGVLQAAADPPAPGAPEGAADPEHQTEAEPGTARAAAEGEDGCAHVDRLVPPGGPGRVGPSTLAGIGLDPEDGEIAVDVDPGGDRLAWRPAPVRSPWSCDPAGCGRW